MIRITQQRRERTHSVQESDPKAGNCNLVFRDRKRYTRGVNILSRYDTCVKSQMLIPFALGKILLPIPFPYINENTQQRGCHRVMMKDFYIYYIPNSIFFIRVYI